MLIDAASPVAAIKELPERNERTFGNEDRQEWSMEFDRKNT